MARDSRETFKAVVAIVVIVGALGFIGFFIHGKRSNPALLRDREVLAIDCLTGEKHVLIKRVDDRWPLINPDTKEDTLWPAWICHEEQILFPGRPNVLITSCPFCGRGSVGGATVDEKGLEVRMVEE